MDRLSRRRFLQQGCALVGASAWPSTFALAAGERFDLVIRNGEVLDPSQKLRAKRDVGVRRARIAAIEPNIALEQGIQSIDATGKLVVPGLVDLHAHVYPLGSAIGLPADSLIVT